MHSCIHVHRVLRMLDILSSCIHSCSGMHQSGDLPPLSYRGQVNRGRAGRGNEASPASAPGCCARTPEHRAGAHPPNGCRGLIAAHVSLPRHLSTAGRNQLSISHQASALYHQHPLLQASPSIPGLEPLVLPASGCNLTVTGPACLRLPQAMLTLPPGCTPSTPAHTKTNKC